MALFATKFRPPFFLERFDTLAEISRIEDTELHVEIVFAELFGVGIDGQLPNHDFVITRGQGCAVRNLRREFFDLVDRNLHLRLPPSLIRNAWPLRCR